MSLFNSLGSNYEAAVISRALRGSRSTESPQELSRMLKRRYGGEVVLTYKGREALTLALTALALPPGSAVAITGFTCYAVDKAVTTAGCVPVYLDLGPNSLNFSPKFLQQALDLTPQIKAVVIQNTLGYPCDAPAIAKICKTAGIILIEDLAHSVGVTYADGREAGMLGDFVMLSFGRDKIIDAVSGGALIARNAKYPLSTAPFSSPPRGPLFRDRLYPALAACIRGSYSVGIGKLVHGTLKQLNLLSRSVDGEYYEGHLLPAWYCELILDRFNGLGHNIGHRQKIATIYKERLNPVLQFVEVAAGSTASSLRFPIQHHDRTGLIKYLALQSIFIADTWYDSPIAPPRFLSKTQYDGQCPRAEVVSKEIINLPTHRAVSEQDAIKLCECINQWLKLQ